MEGRVYIKTFDDIPTEKLWHLIVLAVLKLSPKDKDSLMHPLLATVARELFGIDCETVHSVSTTVHESTAKGIDHHLITGHMDTQGRISLRTKTESQSNFCIKAQKGPQKTIASY